MTYQITASQTAKQRTKWHFDVLHQYDLDFRIDKQGIEENITNFWLTWYDYQVDGEY